MKYSNLITIMFAVMMSMLFATACDGTIQPESDKGKTGVFPTLVCEVDRPKVVASVEATATTDTVISLSVLSKKTISYIRTFTASATAETITFDFKEGDQLVLGGPDLCGGEVKVYITLVYEDGSKSEPFLMDKCDADLNLIGVLTGGEILTDGNAITYLVPTHKPTCQDLDNCTCEELDNCPSTTGWSAGTGNPPTSNNELKWNIVCDAKDGVTLSNIRQYALSEVNNVGDGEFASWTEFTSNANFALTNGSTNTFNASANGLAGDWFAVRSNNVNGTVNSEEMSCRLSAADHTGLFFELGNESYVQDNTRSGSNIVFVTEHNTTTHTITLKNEAGTVVESKTYN